MPATTEHPKTAQMNFRLDPETKEKGDAALAEAGYTPSEAARSLWEVAASGRYRPELIRSFLSGTIAVEYDSTARVKGATEEAFVPSEKAQARLQLLHAGQNREQEFSQKLGLAEKGSIQPSAMEPESFEDDADDFDEELAEALAEAYEEKEKRFAPMTPAEIEKQLRKFGRWQRDQDVA